MKITLTNTGKVAVPVASTDEGGWVEQLQPGAASTIDKAGSDVWIVGDKPGVADALEQAKDALVKLVTFWKDKQKEVEGEEEQGVIHLTIGNEGEKPIRVIPGDPTRDVHVEPNSDLQISAKDYVEIRELGG